MPSELPLPGTAPAATQEFDQLLSGLDEIVGSVFHGHLLIAHQLRDLIKRAAHDAEVLDQAGLKVPNLVELARQHYHEPRLQPVWDMALKLDALRDDVAHRHSPDQVAAKITAFSAPLAAPAGMSSQDVLDRFHKTLSIVQQTLEDVAKQANDR